MSKVTIELPLEVYHRLVKIAAAEWNPVDSDELYNDAVTCGNGDDSFAAGEEQGAASVAGEILGYVVND